MYTDLHIHTKYTKNNSITEIDALIKKTKEYHMNSLAIVDSGNISGVPEFYITCVENGIKPILGLGFYFAKDSRFSQVDEKYHLVILAENNLGLKNLIKLAKCSFREGFYKRPRIDFELLEKHSEGLICLTGGLGGLIDKHLLLEKRDEALKYIDRLISIFGKRHLYLELQDNSVPNNEIMIDALHGIAKEKDLNCVVSGGSFYIDKSDASRCNEVRRANGNNELKGDGYYFKSTEEILNRFSEYEDSVRNSGIIAKRCSVDLDVNKLKEMECESDIEIIEKFEKMISEMFS